MEDTSCDPSSPLMTITDLVPNSGMHQYVEYVGFMHPELDECSDWYLSDTYPTTNLSPEN